MSPSWQHKSSFTYAVSRPFPFRWFTAGAVAGGIIFATLFTFLNFASSGYNLIVQSSSNPNDTVSNGYLTKHWPSFLTTKVRPTCQPVDVPINSQFFTNQTALTYTLTGVWQENGINGDMAIWPSLTYFNNILQQCFITSLVIDMEAMDRSSSQFAFAEWGASVRSYVTCQIVNTDGVVFFNLTQTYDYIPDTVAFAQLYQFLGSGFLSRNETARASLWWGESLMSAYYGALTYQMQLERLNKTNSGEQALRKGTVSFTPYGNSSDITSLSFFDINYQFLIDKGGGAPEIVYYGPVMPVPLTITTLIEENKYPNIWTQADTLAKSVYSTILIDLGQITNTHNMLTDSKLLSSFTSDLGNTSHANFMPGPANSSYQLLKASTGPLGTTPSVISTKYLCQVPQLKSVGSMIIAILVADLVLLQAVWQAYKLLAEMYLTRREPTANYCEGCLRLASGEVLGDVISTKIISHKTSAEHHPLVSISNADNRESAIQ